MLLRKTSTIIITGFKKYGYLSSVSGVTAINYASTSSTGGVTTGEVYGYTLTNLNFTMSLGGYFLASQTGNHTFTMYADDGAYLQFGAGKSCCGNALDDVSDSSFKAEWPYTKTATFSLVKGVYYPMKIVFVNWDGDGGLNVKYTAPDSSVVTEIGSQVYQIQQEYCTTTSTWTGFDTSTITRSASSIISVIVEVPTPTTTITSYWTGDVTSTTSIKGSVGQTDTVVVEVPRATSTSFWTNSYTSTSTVTPSGGGRPTVIIEVPQATTTSYWVNSITSTTTINPDDGSQPTVVIEIPFNTASTRTSTWSDSFTTTSTLTGTDGSLTPIVEVPVSVAPPVTSTWTESYTTTTTLTGTDGVETPIVEVPVSVTPTSSLVSSSSASSTGFSDYTTTFVTTNSDGSVATESGVVDVKTNSAGLHITTTSSFPPSNSFMGESSTSSSVQGVSSVPVVPSSSFTGYHNSTMGTISSSYSLNSFATESESVVTIAPESRASSDLSTASVSVTSSTSSILPSTSAQPGESGSIVDSVSGASGTPTIAPASGTSVTSCDKSGTISTASISAGLIESGSGSSIASGNTANPKHTGGSVVSNSEGHIVSVTAQSSVEMSAVPSKHGTAAPIGGGSRWEAQGASESETGLLSASAASTGDAYVTRTSLPLDSHSSHVVWQSAWTSKSVASSESVSTASVEFGNSAGKSGISMAMIIISVIAFAF